MTVFTARIDVLLGFFVSLPAGGACRQLFGALLEKLQCNTLEISNTTPLPARVYANEGIAQLIFLQADDVCEKSYADKAGKYQDQGGLTLPKVD